MGKEQSRDKSIKAILKAALTLFSKNGFKATTTDQIAARAKVSKGLIYFYFRSKEEILMQLIGEAFKEFEEEIPEELPPLEVIKLFVAGFKASLKDQEKWKLIISVLFQNQNKAAVTKLLKEKYTAFRDLLSLQFQRMGSSTPGEEARHLIATMDGLALQLVFAPDLVKADELIDHIFLQIHKKYHI